MRLKLLCVVAHPDDECFAFGGALALAAREGVETCVLCLTDGQAATNRGDSTSAEELGRMRRSEFQSSCEVLGVEHHRLLRYSDGQLEFAAFSEAAGQLVAKIREYKPDVVLTFAPDGALNTHPDHTMVSMFTTAAFHWAASPKRYPDLGPTHQTQRLYHLTTDFFMDDRPAPLPAPWTVKLDVSSVLPTKQEAFRRHTSQAPLMERTRTMFEEHGSHEFYTLAATVEPQPAHQSTSLFEGLRAGGTDAA